MSFKIVVKEAQTISNRKRHKVIRVEKYKCHHGDFKKKKIIFKNMVIFLNI